MNKRIDLTNLGGFPLEQDTLSFMQDSYRGAFAAIAQLCGSKTILFGVQLLAGNISNGWISYNGEMIQFIGGPAAAQVVITETPGVTQAVFEDGSTRDVYFTKTATVGAVGDFPFTDLKPLSSIIVTQTGLSDLLAAFMAHTHDYNTINGRPMFTQGSAAVGDVSGDKMITVTIPDQGTIFYHVSGTLISNGNGAFDDDVFFVVKNKTATTFQVWMSEFTGSVQNLSFEYLIIKL